jgi:hypothetical protein
MDREFKIKAIEVIDGKLKRKSKYMKVDISTINGKNPGSAASKLFSKFCKVNKKKLDECKVSLAIEDLSTGKSFSYEFERKYEPKTVIINGKEVVYRYSNTKKSI